MRVARFEIISQLQYAMNVKLSCPLALLLPLCHVGNSVGVLEKVGTILSLIAM